MDDLQEKTNGGAMISAEEIAEAGSEIVLGEIGIQPDVLSRLSQSDFELFKPALNNCLSAVAAREQAQNQFAQAQRNEVAAQGAVLYVMSHLRPRYGMGPNDDIDEDGLVIRKE